MVATMQYEEDIELVDADELWYAFFFFQAEDGIRDLTVTGVQTCALPISIAVFQNRLMLHLVEETPYFFTRHAGMIQELHEVGNRLLKINIVLPKSIVGIEDRKSVV